VVDDTSKHNSGDKTTAVAEWAGPYVPVDPAASCDGPAPFKARETGSVRWDDGTLSTNVTLLSDASATQFCPTA
jgi:hypothetical protein